MLHFHPSISDFLLLDFPVAMDKNTYFKINNKNIHMYNYTQFNKLKLIHLCATTSQRKKILKNAEVAKYINTTPHTFTKLQKI